MSKPKLDQRFVCRCHLCNRLVVYPLCWQCEDELEEYERQQISQPSKKQVKRRSKAA